MPFSETSRSVFFLDNLQVYATPNSKFVHAILNARSQRPLFYHSPKERDTQVLSKSGRTLSEIEIFHTKHHPEFQQLIPFIIKTMRTIISIHNAYILEHGNNIHESLRPFETSQKPQISLEDYVWRVADHTYTSPATILSSFIYLDRLMHRYHLLITDINCYKLFFVSIRVASKVLELRTLNNKNFAGIGGITNKHLNELEALFIGLLDFEVFISPLEFQRYASRLHANNATFIKLM